MRKSRGKRCRPLTESEQKFAEDNFHLVLHLAKKFLARYGPIRLQRIGLDFDELVSSITEYYLRSVVGFDPNRGFTFGTYCSHGLWLLMMRIVTTRTYNRIYPSRGSNALEVIQFEVEHKSQTDDKDLVGWLMANLDDREREVLMKRSEGLTLEEIADMHQLTRERIRQIQKIAMRKMDPRAQKFNCN